MRLFAYFMLVLLLLPAPVWAAPDGDPQTVTIRRRRALILRQQAVKRAKQRAIKRAKQKRLKKKKAAVILSANQEIQRP